MNQQFFTLYEAQRECAKRGFEKSVIWWRKMAQHRKLRCGSKVKAKNGKSWIFSSHDIETIVATRPVMHAKQIILSFAFAVLFCGQAFAFTGKASWYSSADACGKQTNAAPGCPTASGRGLFDLERDGVLFCASNDFPLGTKLRVTNTANKKTVECVVLDRGGFKKYGRVLDLGKLAFNKISNHRKGVILVNAQEVVS